MDEFYTTAHKFMFTEEEDTQTLYLQTSALSPLITKQSRGRRKKKLCTIPMEKGYYF